VLPSPDSFRPSAEPPDWVRKIVGMSGYETDAGIDITPDSALTVTAYLACVRIIADITASLPLITYRRLPHGKERALDHYLYPVLHDVANDEMSAFTLRRLLLQHEATRGNGLAEIEFDGGGRVRALWPLNPDNARLWRDPQTLKLFYIYRLPYSVGGHQVSLPAERVFHIKWLSNNGLWGLSPVELAKNAIALAKAAEMNASSFFANGSEPGLVLKSKLELDEDAYKRIRGDWESRHGGLGKKYRVAILEEDMDVATIGVDPKTAQLIESREFSVSDLGRIFGISNDMLNMNGANATYASVEQFGLRFNVYTIRPWVVGFEQEVNRSLLAPSERKTFFAEHLVDGLMRGDFATRMTGYQTGIQIGMYSPNDALEMENHNPYPDGNRHYVPLNWTPVEDVGTDPAADAPTEPPRSQPRLTEERTQRSVGYRRRLMQAQQRVFRDAAGRVLRREKQDILEAARKAFGNGQRDLQSFHTWLDQFYTSHKTFVSRNFSAPMESYSQMVSAAASDEIGYEPPSYRLDAFQSAYLDAYVQRHVAINQANVRELVTEALAKDDPLAALETSLADWQERRTEEIAQKEANRQNNAVSKAVYEMGGFSQVRWNDYDHCPYCKSLHGTVVKINDVFLRAGDAYQPEGVDTPFKINHDLGHPPLCGTCECLITAEK
jgi:HK97 family phage portal protein